MTDWDLTKLKMIARGGEAEIYDIGDGKILRVLTKPGAKLPETEKMLLTTLHKYHIHVPLVYDLFNIDGKPAVLMQKIDGCNLFDYMLNSPSKIPQTSKELAHMHLQIFNITADKLTAIADIVKYFASLPSLLEKRLINFVLETLISLPQEDSLCHGDFHPGNILMQNDDLYIIDWSGAYRGSYLCDVANTYLLMKRVPKIPGQNIESHSAAKSAGIIIANSYLNEILRLKSFDFAVFTKWTVIMSFLRVFNGLPSEKDGRASYIDRCFKMNSKKINAAEWIKLL
jgi:Predicted aminoglycoside phosphotransferase